MTRIPKFYDRSPPLAVCTAKARTNKEQITDHKSMSANQLQKRNNLVTLHGMHKSPAKVQKIATALIWWLGEII